MTDRISEIENRLSEATPGPWECDYQAPFGIGGAVVSMHQVTTKSWHQTHPNEQICKQPHMNKENKNRMFANGRLIADAPSDLRFLLDRVAKLETALQIILIESNSDVPNPSARLEEMRTLARNALADKGGSK
jgi:hypothetical protein